MKSPLVPVAMAFLLGILLGLIASPPPLVVCGVAGISAWIAWWWRRRFPCALPALLSLWVCLGILRVLLWQAHPDVHLNDLLSEEPETVQLHGLVRDDPVERFDWRGAVPEPEHQSQAQPTGQVGVLDLRHVETHQGWQPVRGRVRATFHSPREPLRYGDDILVEGTWSLVPTPGNPGQYDWRAALARQRVHAIINVRPFDGVVLLRRDQGRPWLAWVYGLRQRWEVLIRETFDARDAGLLSSLLLGQRTALDEQLSTAFIETGTVHLLVISGFHVGLIALLLTLVLRLLGVPWRARLLIVAVGLGAYCILVGMRPPVVRATIMTWIVLGALALDRVINWPNVLAAAALVILWMNPMQLIDPGFQLSFGAVLSLLVFATRWRPWVERHLRWVRPRWLRRYVAISLSCTTAIWVGLWPVLAWYFHLISPVSIVANLLIIPLVSLLVVCGTAGLLIGMVAAGFLQVVGPLLSFLLGPVGACVAWCQRLPGGFWYIGQPAWWVLLGYYGLVVLSLLKRRMDWSNGRLLGCWLLAISVWLWTSVAIHAAGSRWLTVEVLDVGHGDSIVVRTPSGHTLLVDAGTQEAGRRRVIPFLRWAGIRTLDALIITHLDEDHRGGAIPVIEALRVKRLLMNGARDDTMTFDRLEEFADQRGVKRDILRSGMSFGDDLGVHIQVFHPPAGFVPGTEPGSNDNSVVLKLTKGAVSVLLTGDLEEAGLPWLLTQKEMLASTVLKVPHHGSALGPVGETFFAAVHPELAIISVGRAHNLPAPATLKTLERLGARVVLTRRDGAIRVRTDGRHLDITTGRGDTSLRAEARGKAEMRDTIPISH